MALLAYTSIILTLKHKVQPMKYMTLSLLLLFSISAHSIQNITLNGYDYREFSTDQDKLEADALFDKKHYLDAFSLYKKIASNGDKYSQYAISDMYFKGLGVEKNIVIAYAWAFVASENNDTDYVNHYQKLKSQLPQELEQQAETKKREVLSTFGNLAIAYDIKKWVYRSLPKCTGSRIRGSTVACTFSYANCSVLDYDKARRIFVVTEGDYGIHCLKSLGYVETDYVSHLKKQLNTVNKYIQQFEGKVTVKRVQ